MIKKYVNYLKTLRNQRKDIPEDYPFVMYPEEKILLQKYLLSAKNYLEFGTGGSTIFSLIHSTVQIISVDTNMPWISFIKKYKIIRNNLGKRLRIHFVDIGATKNWGFPVNLDSKEKFPAFSKEIFTKINPKEIDLILIDGRFRVACTLQAILNCRENKDLKILIHDYSLREDYKIVEEFLDILEKEKTLFVFKINENADDEEVAELYEKYKYIAD